MAFVIKPPNELTEYGNCKIFLAGSIEMGVAEHWQERVELELSNLDITIFNPRRDNWDSSWEQKITNPMFKQQVNWELNALGESDIIIMYLDPNTKSPITLLELGLFASSNKILLCCPEGFYRKGNVDITAEKFNIQTFNSLDDILIHVKKLYSC